MSAIGKVFINFGEKFVKRGQAANAKKLTREGWTQLGTIKNGKAVFIRTTENNAGKRTITRGINLNDASIFTEIVKTRVPGNHTYMEKLVYGKDGKPVEKVLSKKSTNYIERTKMDLTNGEVTNTCLDVMPIGLTYGSGKLSILKYKPFKPVEQTSRNVAKVKTFVG